MAFARCPNCNKAIRYTVKPAVNERWLKDVARSIGHGEAARLLCMNCWLVPEVGDYVAIHEPGEGSEHIKPGECGIVQEIEGEGSPYARYLVLVKNERGTWLEKFMRWQIQAAIFDTDATLVVPIGTANESSSEPEG